VQAWQALSLSFFADITFKTSTTDNQAELQVLDEVEVGLVRTTKQRTSSDKNIGRKLKHQKSGHGLLNRLNFSSNISTAT